MTVTDELLMAYADGELDPETRSRVEREIARSPDLGAKLKRHLALKAELKNAFEPVMSEPIPERLKIAIDGSPSRSDAAVSNIAEARAKDRHRRGAPASPLAWMSMAASVAMGVLIGYLSFNGSGSSEVVAQDGRIVDSTLLGALDRAAASSSGEVSLGVSYLTKSGDYCRSFMTGSSGARSLAGVACHADTMSSGEWRIRMLMAVERAGDSNYRTASSDIPQAVLELIDREIQGEPLDADDEAAAIAKRWKR